MALPKEIQDFLDFLDEQEPFEANSVHLSPQILVEICLKWLTISAEKAKKNPRLVNQPKETAKKLRDLAEKFDQLKQTPSK